MSRKFAYLLAAVAFGGGIVFERLGDSYLFAQEAKKPEWSHGLMLKARKGDEDTFTKDTKRYGVEVLAFVKQVQGIAAEVDVNSVTLAQVEANIVRCPDAAAAERMIGLIEEVRSKGDSVGGIVEGVARGVPAGWGEPVFDRLEADLGKAMLSLPASKGCEVGSGFAGTLLRGTEHNDPYRNIGGKVRTTANRSGGVQGGISNGEMI
jgi:chorismate synthase